KGCDRWRAHRGRARPDDARGGDRPGNDARRSDRPYHPEPVGRRGPRTAGRDRGGTGGRLRVAVDRRAGMNASPLSGRVVVVTRAGPPAHDMTEVLARAGAEVVELAVTAQVDAVDGGAA